jgi:hypothetical protein
MVSCRRKESEISDTSNLLDGDECAENISDTIDSASLTTDESSDTDFDDQEDVQLLDIGQNSYSGVYTYVTNTNFMWEDIRNYAKHKKNFMNYVHVKIVLSVQLTLFISSNNFLLRILYRKL